MPGQLRITIEATALSKLKKLSEPVASQVIRNSIKSYAILLNRRLRENSPIQGRGRTGHFSKSWFVSAKDFILKIVNIARYSPYVEFDTKPHYIFPRFKKVLRWRTGGRGAISAFRATKALARGNFIFSKKVNHPGTKGQRIFSKTFKSTSKEYSEIVKAEVANAFKG